MSTKMVAAWSAAKDKYLNIFSPQMEAIVFIIRQISQGTWFWKLGNILGYSPVLAGEYLPT